MSCRYKKCIQVGMRPENQNIRKARAGVVHGDDDQETLDWKPKKQAKDSNNKGYLFLINISLCLLKQSIYGVHKLKKNVNYSSIFL